MNHAIFGEHWKTQCTTALKQMELALELLDQIEGLGEAGAHLDLAICRMRAVLSDPGSSWQFDPLVCELLNAEASRRA